VASSSDGRDEMKLAPTKVGHIGLGRMGSGIAGRVLGGGHDLVVYNRTPEKAADLVAQGATAAASIAEACAGRDVLITMLADDEALAEVTLGPNGIRDSLAQGAIHMVMGTHGVRVVQQIAAAHEEAGQSLVAAHVLGRPDLAASGQLGIVAAGPGEAVARCRPLFEEIGRQTFEAGERPEGSTAIKLANNFALGCAIEAMGEAFSLVRSYGVPASVLFEVLTEALFAAPAYKVYGQIMVDESYDRVGFTSDLALKDANLILAAADQAGIPLPSVNLYRDRLLSAIAHGDGERDWAVLAREQARAGGLE
jgi:3-hydroxyisobutyrate dehydrogenase-like beta-hydroxyacid dehydrogenase